MARKKVMAANWKMFKNPAQTQAFFDAFLPMVAGHDRDEIVICPPFIDLFIALAATKGSNVAIGAQNLALGKRGGLYRRNLPWHVVGYWLYACHHRAL